jgi:hypothetical protein
MCGGNKRSCYSRGHYTFCSKHPNHIQAVRGYNRPCPAYEAEEKADKLKQAPEENPDGLTEIDGNTTGGKKEGKKKKGKARGTEKKYAA